MAGLRHWPRWATPLTWLIGLLPLGSALWRLGEAVNPVELLTHSTGTWALTGLLLTLTITPLPSHPCLNPVHLCLPQHRRL